MRMSEIFNHHDPTPAGTHSKKIKKNLLQKKWFFTTDKKRALDQRTAINVFGDGRLLTTVEIEQKATHVFIVDFATAVSLVLRYHLKNKKTTNR